MKNTFILRVILVNIAIISGIAASFAQTQTITTGAISPTTYCAGTSISVPFTKTGTFPGGTVFTAQLSDETGSFTSPEATATSTTSPIEIDIPSYAPAGTAYVVRVISVTPAVTGTESADLTINAIPAKPTVSTPINYVVGATASTLTATGSGDLNWYDVATDGTPLADAPTPGTALADVGTASWWVSQTVDGCESTRAKIDVIVSCATAAPTVTSPVNYNVGATATPLTATGSNLKWYTVETNGTALGGAPTPGTTASDVGTKSWWVSQTVAGCEGPRAQIDVIVTCTTAAPTVTATVNYNVGATATPLTATGTALKWYTVETNGTALGGAPTPGTTAADIGTKSWWVSQTLNGCEGPRAKINVVVTCNTPAPTVTATVNYNVGAVATALTATGSGSFKWYTVETNGTALGSAPTPGTTVADLGTKSWWVSQVVNGCEGPRAKIDVIVSACPTTAPTVTATVNYNVGATATPLTATGTALKWYTVATNGTALGGAPTPGTTAADIGTKSWWVSQTVGGCEGPRAKIDVVVTCATAAPAVNDTVKYNVGATATPLTATGTALKWYTVATNGTALGGAPTPGTTAADIGTKSWWVSQTLNGCEGPRAKIDVIVTCATTAPVADTVIVYCSGETAIKLTATGSGLKWYTVATSGTPLGTAPTPGTTTADIGTKSWWVSQTLNGCEGPRRKIQVTVNATPATLTALSEEVCQERADRIYTFPTKAATGNSLLWYTKATGGAAATTTPTVNLKDAGETIYYVTQETSKGCESDTRVQQKIRVKALPGLPTVTPSSLTYCQFVQATPLVATPSASATLNWFGTDATGGTSSATAPTPSTENGGTLSYYVAQTLEGCIGNRAKIDVTINTTPVPQTTTALAFCQGAPAEPLTATGNELKWYRASGESQTTPFTPFTEKYEDYSFFVTQTGAVNRCESPKLEIKIHIKALPSASISGNSTIDLGGTAAVRIDFTSDGPWKYVLSDSTKGETTNQHLDVQVRPSVTTTYRVSEVSNACGKGIPLGAATVTVKVPTISTGNPSVAEACAGKTFQVLFQKSGDFQATNQFKVQIAPQAAVPVFYSIPSVVNGSTITATFPDTTKAGNYVVRVVSEGADPAFTVKGNVSEIPITAKPLPIATITGSQTIVIGETAELSIALSAAGPWSFNLNNGTSDSLINTNASPYKIAVAPQKTTTYTISSVTNGCGTGRVIGTARVQVDPILGIEPPVVNLAKVYPTIVRDQCTVEIIGKIHAGGVKLDVLNMSGSVLQNRSSKDQINNFNFSGYPSGLYLIRIENGDAIRTYKVIKP